MVTHDPHGGRGAQAIVHLEKGELSQTRELRALTARVSPEAHLPQRAAPPPAHAASRCSGWWSRCSPSACCRPWSTPGTRAPTPPRRAPGHAQCDLAGVPAAAELRDRIRGVEGVKAVAHSQLVRRHLLRSRRISSRSSPSTATTISICTRSSSSCPTSCALSCATARAPSSGASSPTSYGFKVGRRGAAARHDLSGHLGVRRARHLRRQRRDQDHRAVAFSTGTISTRRCARPRPRRADQVGVLRHRHRPTRTRAAEVAAAIDARVQELAGRNAHRNRAGVPARLRRHVRGDRGRDPHRLLRGHPHHHGGDGQHHGDDARASAPPNTRRSRRWASAPGFCRGADLRRVADDRRCRRRHRHRC